MGQIHGISTLLQQRQKLHWFLLLMLVTTARVLCDASRVVRLDIVKLISRLVIVVGFF